MITISLNKEYWKDIRDDRSEVLELLREYGSQRALADELDESRTTIQYWVHKHGIEADEYLDFKDSKVAPDKEHKPSVIRQVEDSGVYYEIKASSGFYKVSKEEINEFLKLYSQAGMTKNSVANEMEISRDRLNAIWSAFDITHDSIPFLEEDIEEYGADRLAEKSLEREKNLYWRVLDKKKENKAYKELKKYYKEDWKLKKVINNLKEVIDETEYDKPQNIIGEEEREDNILVVNLSDLHVGKKVLSSDFLLDKSIEGFNQNIFEKRIEKYIKDIIQLIKFYSPEKVCILNSGDGLDSPDGDVYKKQKLNQDIRGEKQFLEYVYKVQDIILSIYNYIDNIEFYAVGGNHSKNDIINWDILSGMMLQELLDDYDNINFNVKKTKYKIIELYNTNIVLTHGNYLRSGKYTREVDLLNIVRMGELNNKQTYVISAHEHHYQSKEGVKYRWIKLPSIVGGDELSSDILNVSSRPSQVVFRITKQGLESEHFVYFD